MKRISLAISLLLSSTEAIKMFTNNNIHSTHRSTNLRLEAWNEISKNVNVPELIQSEEDSLNEQIPGQNLNVEERVEKNQQQLAQQDPTQGDLPDNSGQYDVVANILSSPTTNQQQKKLVEDVTDNHARTGLTKNPVVPVPQVNVTDVESQPDPIHVDPDSEVTDAPNTTAPLAEIAPSSLSQKQSLGQQMLAEVNKDQGQQKNENSQFLAMKQAHSQRIVEKVSNMNKEMDEFSHTLDMKHYDNAISLQQQLKKDGLKDHEKLMSVTTKQLFQKGFKAFPQIVKNEYVQDQLQYLEAAEDNLNGNLINPRLVQALVDRGQEVAQNLSQTYGEQWSNPLKD